VIQSEATSGLEGLNIILNCLKSTLNKLLLSMAPSQMP
jgi:hypothetical protein